MTDAADLQDLASLVADLRAHVQLQRSFAAWAPTAEAPELPAVPTAGPPSVKAAAPTRPNTHTRPIAPAADAWKTAAPASPRAPARTGPSAAARPPAAPLLTPSPGFGPAPAERLLACADLGALRAEIGDCRRCKLAPGRTNLVFGVGPERAEILFVGEGPGFHEDRKGEPFVGEAGALLDNIIERVLRLDRSQVYIANVVKCRPPNNRDPEPDEVAACSPFLHRQVQLVQPKVVVGLGRFAVQSLLGVQAPISKLRGQAHPYGDAVLVPTFHPAYLLRNPQDKRLTMDDMKLVRAEYERATGRALPPPLRRSDVEGTA